MKLNEIFELPKETENTVVYDAFYATVTEYDINEGTDPKCFAYAQLIEWAIRNKKYEEYYSYMQPYQRDDKKRWEIEEYLTKSKTVIVRFNFMATPLFGFLVDNDGGYAIEFPTKDGMRCLYL